MPDSEKPSSVSDSAETPPSDADVTDLTVSSDETQETSEPVWEKPVQEEKKPDIPLAPAETSSRAVKPISPLRFFFTIFLTFFLSWTLLSFLAQGLTAGKTSDPYQAACPEESTELATVINETKLLQGNLGDLYPIGTEKATPDLYARTATGCKLEYLVFPTAVAGDVAKTRLNEAGWAVETNSPGLFQAEKTVNGTTYSLTYPSGENSDTTSLTMHLSYPPAQ